MTFDDDVSPGSSVSPVRTAPLFPGFAVEGGGSVPPRSGHYLHPAMIHETAALCGETDRVKQRLCAEREAADARL